MSHEFNIFIPLMHNASKWSDTQTILEHYALKGYNNDELC